MDEICSALFSKLCEGGTGTYRIFYEDELLDELDGEVRNRETLEAALKRLLNEGCIDVKYARGDAFCIAAVKEFSPTPPPVEKKEEEPLPVIIRESPVQSPVKNYFWVMLSAFCGSLLGGLCAVLGAVVL